MSIKDFQPAGLADVPENKQYLNDFQPTGLASTALPEDESKGFTGHVRDLGVSALKGAIAVPETVVGLADIPTGGRVGKFLENEGGSIGFRPKEAKGILSGLHTDQYKTQQQEFADADGVMAKAGVALSNPSLIANTVTESLPSVGAGGVAARGLLGATRLGAMGTTGQVAAGSIGEGAVMAGAQAEGIRQATEDGLLTPEQSALSVATGGLGALFSFAGGRLAQKLGIGDVDTLAARGALNPADVAGEIAQMPAKSIPRKVIEGAMTEGFLEELPQSISEQILQNLALDKAWSDGVEDAAVMGTLAGMVMGGAAGGVSPSQNAAPAPAGGIDAGLVQPTPTPESPAPTPVERPDPANGPISAAASKMAPVQTAEDLGVQFPEQQDWSQYDQPAVKRGVQAERGYEGLDGLIATTERMGFADEAAQLITARRLFQQAEQARAAGDEVTAGQYAERGNRLYQFATEVNDQVRTAAYQFPVPYVATGEIAGGEVGPYQGGPDRAGNTYDQPRRMSDPTPAALEQRQDNRLTDSGIIFGEEPADVRADREQRAADDFSARYGQEGQARIRSEEGEYVPRGTITDEGRMSPDQYQRPAQLEDNRMGGLPEGTGQIDMGRDRPERTFTPPPAEYEGVGRNVVEQQAGLDIARLENRKTVTQGEMIELTRQFREAVTTKPVNRTEEQKHLIKALPKLKKQVNAGAVPVTQNMQSDLDPQLAGQQIDSEWTEFAPQSGTLNVPRAQMPQVKTEHRGALVNFLNAKGVQHEQVEIDPVQLKPTQQEFAPGKVDRARQHKGGERSILISSDGHVVDGHHQWMAKRERGEPVKAIQLSAPIRDLLPMVSEFPSSARDEGAVTTPDTPATTQVAAPELRMKSDGSPFASEIAAKRSMPYKQNIEYAEVVPVDGGFAVLVDTQAQDEADTKAVEQQQARTQQAKTRMYRAPDPVNDDMLDAIALLGGIDRAEAEAEGVDPANFGRQAGGIRYLFPRNGGDSFDGMAERIAQYGYLDANADRLDDFRAKLDQAINGSRKVMTPQGYEALAEKELAAEAQLQEEHEPLAGDITSDEAWAGEAYAMALEAGVPINVIDAILEKYGADPIATLVELNDAINEVNNARAAQAGEGTQGRSADTEIPWNEPGNLSDVDIKALFGEPEQDAEPLLTAYTEADLQAQAGAQSAAEQAEAEAQQKSEQKAQADAEVGDFTLSGSNRPADVAESRGQNDMFGAGSSAQTEPANPSEQAPQSAEQQPVSTEQPAKKKLYIPTGIQSGIEATEQLNDLINNGEPVSADEVRRVFDYVMGNEASVRAELNRLKKGQLKQLVSGHVWSDTKKAELVDRAYESMIGDFRFIGNESGVVTSTGFGIGNLRNQASEHVKALTDEQVAEYARNRKAMIDERMAERKTYIDSLSNPQTLEDYREAIRVRGIDKLTPEQRATYDRMVAEETMASRQPDIERAGLQTDEQVELGEPTEGTHGKTGETIFNVKVITRLDKEKFKESAAFARSMGGGYYRGNFYFKSREDAELFSGWVNGESVDLADRNQQRQEKKQANAADKLKTMADRIEQQANEALNADRKENTAKRMREADYARANAEKDATMAAIMRGVAEFDSPLLKGMTQKVQVELMERMVNSLKYNAPRDLLDTDREGRQRFKQDVTPEQQVQFAQMPVQDMYAHIAKDLANDMLKTKGFKLHARRLQAASRGVADSTVIALDDTLTAKIVEFADKHAPDTSTLKGSAANYKRLQRMGITNKPTLRTALLEFMQIRDGAAGSRAAPSRLQSLERDLQRTMVGNRRAFNDFFPTPQAVAEEVIGQAEIEPGMRVLEPSAGNGMLADAAKAAGAEVDVVEMGGQLREILGEKGYNLVGDDFLEYQVGEQYDRIVMNPPFSKDQDIEHVSHAYDQLKPGGKLVAIVSGSAGDRANTRNRQFREWLDNLDAVEQPLPQGAFLSSMNQTGVNTKVLVIEKPMSQQAGNAPQAEAIDSTDNTVTKQGVTVEVPTIDQQLVDDYNRATHMGRGRDLNAELRSEAEGLLNDLAGRKYTLDTPEQQAAARRMIESYLQRQAEFSRWSAQFSANNPSWIVTGRSGRNMDKSNRANERHMDEYTKRVDRLQAQRDGIGEALYSMRPKEVQENQALMKDLREATRMAGTILADIDSKVLAADTRKWASPKAHKLIERSLEADRQRTIEHIRELENTKAVQDAGGLAKVFGPRSKAGKLVQELLVEETPRFSRAEDNSVDPEYTPGKANPFWEGLNNGALRRGSGNSRLVQKKWVEKNLTSGHSRSKRGQLRIVAGRAGSGTETIRFERGIAGFQGVVTSGQVAEKPDGNKVFIYTVTPVDLLNNANRDNAAVLTITLAEGQPNEYEVGIFGPVEGGAAAQVLAGTEYLSDTGSTNTQGLKYLKLNIGNAATKSFLSEAVRRLAMHNGRAPDAVLYSARDTGARAGDKTVRKFDRNIIESKFSRAADDDAARSELVDSTATGAAIPLEDVERAAGRIVSSWKNAPDWSVVATDFDLPAELQSEIEEQNARGQIDGVFHGGRFYLVAEHIRSESDVERIIFHEALGHYGLQQLYGPALKLHLDQLWNRIGGLDGVNRLQKTYNFGMGSYWHNSKHMDPTERRVMMMDELVAHIAATGTYQPDIIQRIAHLVRQGLRKIMAGTRFAERLNRMTDVEVLRIVAAARHAVVEGESRVTTLTHDPRFVRMFDEAMYGVEDGPRFSRTDNEVFAAPEETHLKVALRKMADKFQVLKDLQKNIKDADGTVTEENDAYLAEELFHGKTEEDLRQMRETFIKPLADKMAKFGIEQKDLDQYLYAKHAPERNAHIAEINPELQEAGSGMSDAKAAEVIRTVRDTGKLEQYEHLAGMVYDMLETRRETMRSAGLEEDGMIDAWENKYEFYVPLKGWAVDEQQDSMARTGKGFNIAGKESRRAMGRSSEAASPSSYAIQDLTETLIRRRKNEVGNALLKLAQDNPNKAYWQVFTSDNPDIDRQIFRSETEASKQARAAAKKAGQPEPDRQYQETVRETPIPMAMMSDKYFQTKRKGRVYFIKLEDERLMKAMKNIGPDTSNFLIRNLGAVNRVLSSLNTSYNPEFVVGNFARDVQTAVLNLMAEQSRDDGKVLGENIAKQTVKDIPKAMKAVYRGLRNKDEAAGGEWQKWFTEFREAGAKTGWFDMKDIDGQAADLQSLISMAKGGVKGNAMKWFKATGQMVEDLNGSVENAVRLSAYVNARKAGISQAKAASLAKNMTVNFNRRGEVGTTLNALYMFANASIQGSMNFARTMIGLKGQKGDLVWQRLNTAQKVAAGLVMGSFAIAMVNRAGAGEDDDGENWYDKVPDYVKERNLVIMKSLLGGDQDGSYWSIPLPYGYNIFHVFGNTLEGTTNGNTSIGKAATDLTLATLGSFSPIGFQESQTLSGTIARNITPTLGKPIADIVANENFMGTSIYNENFPFGTPKPESQLGRRSTPEGYKAIAEFLNDVSGGSQWRSGYIDINPDVMRYMANYFTGAAGKFVFDKAPNNLYHLATLTPIEARETLFVSRVSGRVLPYEDREKFYSRRDEINQTEAEWKGLRGADRMSFYRDNRNLIRLKPLIKSSEKQLKALRQQRDRIYALDLPRKQQEARMEVIEARMKRVIDRFNREYANATGGD